MRSLQSRPCLLIVAAVISGILIDRYLAVHPLVAVAILLASLIAWTVLVYGAAMRGSSLLVLAAVASLSSLSHAWHWRVCAGNEIALCVPAQSATDGLPVAVRGTILALDPVHRDERDGRCWTSACVAVNAVRDQQRWRPASGRCRATIQGDASFLRLADRVEIHGKLSRIGGPLNPGQVNWQEISRQQRLFCRIRIPSRESIRVLRRPAWDVRRAVEGLRRTMRRQLAQFVGPPHDALAAALILGDRSGVTEDCRERFLRTGMLHLLSVSGLHVGVVASVVLLITRVHRRSSLQAMGVVVATTGFALLTQARAPVVRATCLVYAACLSDATSRRGIASNILSAAAIVVLLLSPPSLFSSGAQLSFLAVSTLVWVGPDCVPAPVTDPLRKLVLRSRRRSDRILRQSLLRLRQGLLLSVAVWATSLPLVMHHYHVVAPWSIPLNLLVWLPMAVAMTAGLAVALGLAVVSTGLAIVCGSLCAISLGTMVGLIDAAFRLVPAAKWVAGWDPRLMLGYYVLLAAIALLSTRRPVWPWPVLLLIVGLLADTLIDHRTTVSHRGSLRCSFLSLGHGTCVVLLLPDGQCVLYDCGRLGTTTAGVDTVSRFLWLHNVRRLDAVVVSHADTDHFSLLPGLLERFECGLVYVSPFMFDAPSLSVADLHARLRARGSLLRTVYRSMELPVGGSVDLRVLHPPADQSFETDNANSVVLSVTFAGSRILLTGDVEESGLDCLLQQSLAPHDIVMAPHHGSAKSRPVAIAERLGASHLIVSGAGESGHRLDWLAHPSERLKIWHTGVDGAISIELTPGPNRELRAFLPSRP